MYELPEVGAAIHNPPPPPPHTHTRPLPHRFLSFPTALILDEYVVTVVYSFNGDKRRRSFKAAAGIPHGVNFELFFSKIKA